ncbi:aminotransferase class IV [Aquimarina brevivitae]|uniref:branched-chain-amino-acid transaminase n=1 Tax=Aquimarina brevivitae TaxID=323412 RepID=A0A4Q7NU73_9FLAO|nr:aminotransferase class IV [Aquimarina brevivitae]RZS90697.1 branched-chain amino acid aminotransferase [Aquimarina brevivitae]
MINLNGELCKDEQALIHLSNRGYAYGDAVFETIRVNQGKILFWEDHYFRLMASMRILRMQIPMEFTPEFLEEEICTLVDKNQLQDKAARIKITVSRHAEGFYTPLSNEVVYTIQASEITNGFYTIEESDYEVTLFKDHYVMADLLSTVKSNNKAVNVLAGIFAKENGFQNALLLNSNKMVIEAINGNLFLVKDNVIKTPPLADGCLRGILRTQLLRILEKLDDYEVKEESISPFELQKADELFITNVITGIQPISKYKKKAYRTIVAKRLLGTLNARVRLT